MLTKSTLAAAVLVVMTSQAVHARTMRLVGTKVDQSRATTQSMKLQAPNADPAAKHLKKGDRIRIGGLGILQARSSAVGQRGLRRR